MKKLIYTLGIAAIIAGCQQIQIEEATEPVSGEPFKIEAGVAGSKVTFTPPLTVAWDADDALSVIVNDAGTYSAYEFTKSTSGTNTFECSAYTPTETVTDYYLFYPYNQYYNNIGTDGFGNAYIEIGSSASGSQAQTGINSGAHIDTPLCAHATADEISSGVTMMHVSTVLDVKVNNTSGSDITVSKVSVTNNGSQNMVGTFYINPQTKELKSSGSNYVSSTANLTVTEGIVTNGTTASFYESVRLSTYSRS